MEIIQQQQQQTNNSLYQENVQKVRQNYNNIAIFKEQDLLNQNLQNFIDSQLDQLPQYIGLTYILSDSKLVIQKLKEIFKNQQKQANQKEEKNEAKIVYYPDISENQLLILNEEVLETNQPLLLKQRSSSFDQNLIQNRQSYQQQQQINLNNTLNKKDMAKSSIENLEHFQNLDLGIPIDKYFLQQYLENGTQNLSLQSFQDRKKSVENIFLNNKIVEKIAKKEIRSDISQNKISEYDNEEKNFKKIVISYQLNVKKDELKKQIDLQVQNYKQQILDNSIYDFLNLKQIRNSLIEIGTSDFWKQDQKNQLFQYLLKNCPKYVRYQNTKTKAYIENEISNLFRFQIYNIHKKLKQEFLSKIQEKIRYHKQQFKEQEKNQDQNIQASQNQQDEQQVGKQMSEVIWKIKYFGLCTYLY
ncbi:hypothetical protein PPERSA_02366 [Pseudocohnilembus persalinus]|uniref:Uncharacterized protein n=1 Tax=Pseudocohnilembus persalinus TaxID=266149 RepID=A0A0V0QUW6_PSEPJ|nr:hypothetical protein PPERSA_02366 [Pseudocohnilembus persalinus]|eukprot:KRX05834.1 hypothetical protein PPERSA_02366 [Pseudocohnilembus persalinus]